LTSLPATRLTGRALVRLAAADPAEDVRQFLQGLVTNDVVAGPLPCWAALLSPQGKVLFDFLVWADGADLLLDCEATAADALAKRLSLYRLRRKLTIAREPGLAVHWSAVPQAGAVADPRLPALGWRWLAPAGEADAGADAAWLAHRLAEGVAEGAAELGDLLWLECNAAELNGVSFTKGCYVGQENTARMNWRQKVNRRLVVVPLADSDPARQRCGWPAFGVALDHRRVEDIATAAVPGWLAAALS
jgi:folate-binding protein YgfZ